MKETATHIGRPRSEEARVAVLNAVDDLLREIGYSAMTMKGIAERAGVGRQTVYRWWATKAEVLLEASIEDAADEIDVPLEGDHLSRIEQYLSSLLTFLSESDPGRAYLALLAAAQQDEAVAGLLRDRDPLVFSAQELLEGLRLGESRAPMRAMWVSQLVGPVLHWVLVGNPPGDFDPRMVARSIAAIETQTDTLHNAASAQPAQSDTARSVTHGTSNESDA